jgi:hypothetical protein
LYVPERVDEPFFTLTVGFQAMNAPPNAAAAVNLDGAAAGGADGGGAVIVTVFLENLRD